MSVSRCGVPSPETGAKCVMELSGGPHYGPHTDWVTSWDNEHVPPPRPKATRTRKAQNAHLSELAAQVGTRTSYNPVRDGRHLARADEVDRAKVGAAAVAPHLNRLQGEVLAWCQQRLEVWFTDEEISSELSPSHARRRREVWAEHADTGLFEVRQRPGDTHGRCEYLMHCDP